MWKTEPDKANQAVLVLARLSYAKLSQIKLVSSMHGLLSPTNSSKTMESKAGYAQEGQTKLNQAELTLYLENVRAEREV